MSINKEFFGYHKEPSLPEILILLSVLNYARNKFGILYKNYEDGSKGPITGSSHSNAENKKTMSADVYASYTRKLHQNLVARDSASQKFTRLTEVDAYMRPLVADIFPDIGIFWGIRKDEKIETENTKCLLLPHAVQGSGAFDKLMQGFRNGGYIYRYAKNTDIDRGEIPRLAIGHLDLPVFCFLRGDVEHAGATVLSLVR